MKIKEIQIFSILGIIVQDDEDNFKPPQVLQNQSDKWSFLMHPPLKKTNKTINKSPEKQKTNSTVFSGNYFAFNFLSLF